MRQEMEVLQQIIQFCTNSAKIIILDTFSNVNGIFKKIAKTVPVTAAARRRAIRKSAPAC